VPAVGWLRHYRRAWLGGDLVAALTTWALVVPQAIAYAQIAGLPPQAGLFAAFAGLLGYGLFGTCRQLIVSPTSSTAAISAAIVAPVAPSATRSASPPPRPPWPCSSGWC
jgi:sulfate permease, SulP family